MMQLSRALAETRRAPADRSRGDKRAFASVRSHSRHRDCQGFTNR
jgi:hypothetical protein